MGGGGRQRGTSDISGPAPTFQTGDREREGWSVEGVADGDIRHPGPALIFPRSSSDIPDRGWGVVVVVEGVAEGGIRHPQPALTFQTGDDGGWGVEGEAEGDLQPSRPVFRATR